MSLNCLNCQALSRTESENEFKERLNNQEKLKFRVWLGEVERSWSGNLSSRAFDKRRERMMTQVGARNVQNDLHRVHNGEGIAFQCPGTPRLVRSSGMRRDWSFENLREGVKG